MTRCNTVVLLVHYIEKALPDETDHIDPPWLVLNLRFCPDNLFRPGRNPAYFKLYNGPDAFLSTVYIEVYHAIHRLHLIIDRIQRLTIPSKEFMFQQSLRDERLLDNSLFVWTKRYLWAIHVLSEIEQCVAQMIRTLNQIWNPDVDWSDDSPCDLHWPIMNGKKRETKYGVPAKRLKRHAAKFRRLRNSLEQLTTNSHKLGLHIQSLQTTLYNGTAVLESRRTTQHGENVKLLTIVNCCFLPLTFIMSVFGMTNMPQGENFVRFGIALVTVCVPLFAVIVFASSHYGYSVVKKVAKGIIESPGNLDSAVRNTKKEDLNPLRIWRKYRTQWGRRTHQSTTSMVDAEAQRNGSTKSKIRKDKNDGDEPESYPHIREIVKAVGERR